MKHKRKIEFSKKIFYMLSGLTLFVVINGVALMWYTKDISALSYLIPSTFGLTSTSVGFYYWKSKAENKIKLEKKYGIEVELDEETIGN